MSTTTAHQMHGLGRALVAIYAIMALAATGRSAVQIMTRFDTAPVAFTLSAVAAGVYILATVALALYNRSALWRRVAWFAVIFELVGVLVVGTLSIVNPALFAHDTVWSMYGAGYYWVPLVLPVLGLWWLYSNRPGARHRYSLRPRPEPTP